MSRHVHMYICSYPHNAPTNEELLVMLLCPKYDIVYGVPNELATESLFFFNVKQIKK